jgi:NAD(P)H-dependent nitrite reductase small subunit
MPEPVILVAADALRDGESRAIRVGDKEVAVFRVGEEFYAIDNECSHYGAPLCDGWTDGTTVSCPWHCWQFDVTTGKCLTVEDYDVQSYPVRIEDGQVKIEI